MSEFEGRYLEQFAIHDNILTEARGTYQFVLDLKPGVTFSDFLERVRSIEVRDDFNGWDTFDLDDGTLETTKISGTHTGGILSPQLYSGFDDYLGRKGDLDDEAQLSPICYVGRDEMSGSLVIVAYQRGFDEDFFIYCQVDDLRDFVDFVEDGDFLKKLRDARRRIPDGQLPAHIQFSNFIERSIQCEPDNT